MWLGLDFKLQGSVEGKVDNGIGAARRGEAKRCWLTSNSHPTDSR